MVDSYGGMAERVRDFADDLEDAFADATESALDDLRNYVRMRLIRNQSVARTVLLRDVDEGPVIPASANVIVSRAVHLPEFAKYLEYGTGDRGRTDDLRGSITYDGPSGLPPYDPILQWVLAKNLQSDEYGSQYALAEAIRRTIGEEGTFPHPFVRPAWRGPNGKVGIVTENRRALRQTVRRV